MERWREAITYQDELLTDGSVRRAYSDGRFEWRRKLDEWRVEWEDSSGARGVDELLGNGVVKRTLAGGGYLYAREQGFGRTAWSDGRLTVNATSFGGRTGAVLAGLGAGALLTSITPPPMELTLAEEAALRQQRQQAGSSGNGGGGDGGGTIGDGDADAEDEEAGEVEVGTGITHEVDLFADGDDGAEGDFG